MKLGILGFGYMGTLRFAAAAARDDCEVVRIYHTSPDVPRPHAARWEEVTDDPRIEAIHVCLPTWLTAAATCRALEAGKHVLAEKPPGTTLSETKRMVDAARASGRTLQFGFDLRQHPSIRQLRALVAERALGEIRWARGVYGKPKPTDFEASWRADPERAGAGILLDQGIHLLDVLATIAGPFPEIAALARTDPGARVEDDVMVVLRSETGALASLHSSQHQSPPRFALEVGLSAGCIALEGLLTRSGRYGPERIAWGPLDRPRAHERSFGSADPWADELTAFLRAVREGSEPPDGSAAQALALMGLVERIYAASGVRVRER
ncbi:MAG: Gfo/Idh/MocA family oxidoreductase [Sandaracinus sp.]